MKSVKFRMIAIALLSAAMPFTAKAQDKVEASVGADFVSNYIWRGTDCGGVSIQPSMGVSYKGLSLTAWGSVGIDKEDAREIDLTGLQYRRFQRIRYRLLVLLPQRGWRIYGRLFQVWRT